MGKFKLRQDSHFVVRNFSKRTPDLRREFERVMGDPRGLSPRRFQWDPWCVKKQYSHLRTPAYHFFSKQIYEPLHRELVLWGRRNLGCWDISPPFLSLFLDGHHQNLHCDVPHGPWAFVLSLCPKRISFDGGETFLLKPETLNFWRSHWKHSFFEQEQLLDTLAPRFNNLIVFDPRFPHGVTPVKGPQDPLDGRLVLQGWFSRPETYIEGPLPKIKTTRILNAALAEVLRGQDEIDARGICALQLEVQGSGKVRSAKYLTCNVRDSLGNSPLPILQQILDKYGQLRFPQAKASSKVVVPFVFD